MSDNTEFNKELFYDLCKKYNVKLSDKYGTSMLNTPNGIRRLSDDIEILFREGRDMSFRKSDLRSWDIITLRNGTRHIANLEGGIIVGVNGFELIEAYTDTLERPGRERLDIVVVHRVKGHFSLHDINNIELSDCDMIYERT